MASSSLLNRILESLLPSAGALAGFLLAWVLFELTEWRRRIRQRNAIRHALRAELRNSEVVLNSLVTRFAVGVGDMQTAVKELRWLMKEGWSKERLSDLTPEMQANWVSKSDNELADLLRRTGWKQRSVEVPIPLPLVEAVLSSPLADLSPEEMENLTRLKWQSHLLDNQAHWMEQWTALMFTVEDEENHSIIVKNHEGAKE